jgi:glucose/arabinose dehydrogenase
VKIDVRITFALAVLAGATWAQSVPTDFVDELVQPGYVKPIGLAFLPDGRALVVEQESHVVFVLTAAGAQGPIGTIPGVANGIIEDERGVQHIAIDPQWPARPYLYCWYTHAAPQTMWLSMFTVTGDLADPASTTLALGAQYVILNDIPKVSENHNGGSIRFGPDGMLYLSTGEDYQFCPAQDLGSGLGKVLRLDVSTLPGAGSGPPPKVQIAAAGNPFVGPNDMARLVWAYGLRNPFRFHIDPLTGALMLADVGESTWEEVDWCTTGGQNFGWPWFEANLANQGCGGTAPSWVPPVASHPHSAAFYCIISLGIYRNVSAGAFNFGFAYEGDYFYTDYIGGYINRLKFNGSTWFSPAAVPGQPTPTHWGAGFLFITDSTVGPDGALYYLKRQPGELRRIRSTANPPTLLAYTGQGQAVTAGAPAVAPLAVRATNIAGMPIVGLPVSFAVTTGGGQVGPQPVLTDAQGVASTSFVPSLTDTTNPVVTASTPGSASLPLNLVWRGLVVNYVPQPSTLSLAVHHSEASSPLTLAVEIPPSPSPLLITPWGDLWTHVLTPGPGFLALDGLGLLGPPDPNMVTGNPAPIWATTFPNLPAFGGVPVVFQAYAVDWARVPAPDAYLISNPATITLS